MQSDPRVWVVLDLEPKKRGSLEQGIVALATRLQAMRIETTFVFSAPPVDWLAAALEERGTQVRVLDFRRPAHASAEFRRWLAESTPDLVHFHFVRAYSSLVLLAHNAGARVVVHDHITLGQPVTPGRDHSERTKRILRPLKRLRAMALNRFVDRRIAVSVFVAASIMDAEFFPSERIEVVPNGVDLSRFLAGDAMKVRWEQKIGARPVVGCVSRMAPEKGVQTLIRAFSRLPAETALVIAGDGPDSERCKRTAAELGVGDRVHFLGLRDDVENVYAASDVVVMPSEWDEAFGLCVVEAMAAAKPLVVTDSGAMPEIVANGQCGAIVPKADEAALARTIGELLQDRARAEALGQAARQRAVEVYPISRWVDGIVGAYGRTLPQIGRAELIDFAEPSGPTPRDEAPTDSSGTQSASG